MVRWKRDVLVGVLFGLFCVVAFITSFSIPVGTMGDIPLAQPGNYLRMWLGVFGILCLALIINAIRKKDTTPTEKMFHGQVIFTLILLAVYIYVMDIIGFMVATTIFTTVIILEYSWAAGKFQDAEGKMKQGPALIKAVVFYIVIAIIVTYATDALFRNVLNVALPTWSL